MTPPDSEPVRDFRKRVLNEMLLATERALKIGLPYDRAYPPPGKRKNRATNCAECDCRIDWRNAYCHTCTSRHSMRQLAHRRNIARAVRDRLTPVPPE